jgi:hypothetical protein
LWSFPSSTYLCLAVSSPAMTPTSPERPVLPHPARACEIAAWISVKRRSSHPRTGLAEISRGSNISVTFGG